MSAFRWTPKRDALLAECRGARFTWAETERALGCKPGVARARWQQLQDQEYQGACGTAREAPTGSSSGDPVAEGNPQAEDTARPATCDTVSAPPPAGDATGSPDVSPANPIAETPPQAETTAKEPGTPDTTKRPRVTTTQFGRADTSEQASDRQVGASPTVTPYDPRPPADSREPCWKCGTRGDIGCRHQRAFVA